MCAYSRGGGETMTDQSNNSIPPKSILVKQQEHLAYRRMNKGFRIGTVGDPQIATSLKRLTSIEMMTLQ